MRTRTRGAGLALALLALGLVAVLVSRAPEVVAAAEPAAPASRSPARDVKVETLTAGQGDRPPAGSYVLIDYKGLLADGTVFDHAEHAPMALDEVVPGFARGLVQMQRGGRYRLTIPSELGYGARAMGPIPANSDLVFEIALIDFKTPDEIAALVAQRRQGVQPQQPGQ